MNRTTEVKVSRIHEHRVQHMRMRNTDKLARAKARPDPAQWGEDEVMTLGRGYCSVFSGRPIDVVIIAQGRGRWDS